MTKNVDKHFGGASGVAEPVSALYRNSKHDGGSRGVGVGVWGWGWVGGGGVGGMKEHVLTVGAVSSKSDWNI